MGNSWLVAVMTGRSEFGQLRRSTGKIRCYYEGMIKKLARNCEVQVNLLTLPGGDRLDLTQESV
jgi:hypothetical protein